MSRKGKCAISSGKGHPRKQGMSILEKKKKPKQCKYENLILKHVLAFGYKIGGVHYRIIKVMS